MNGISKWVICGKQINLFGFQFTDLPISNKHFFVFNILSAGSVAGTIRFEKGHARIESGNDGANAAHGREDFMLQ